MHLWRCYQSMLSVVSSARRTSHMSTVSQSRRGGSCPPSIPLGSSGIESYPSTRVVLMLSTCIRF
ncbi:hypothetical protein C8Q70DRAFT_971590 [Cubamyces menziesii]|nr:hypothetical protein C8Q70DRAFT_971590 [Cubamyces menziesii]